ncbi:MAG: formate dehydrogenase accessory sulfurtransferase FdhD [Bradymonadia bacterium]
MKTVDRAPRGAVTAVDVVTEGFPRTDSLVTESPLQLVINNRRFAVLMRTPATAIDSDIHLALGFMYSEGIIDDVDDVTAIGYCVDQANLNRHNTMRVQLHDGGGLNERLKNTYRSTSVSSACGSCGRIDALELLTTFPNRSVYSVPRIDFVQRLPALLRQQQSIFDETGGIHGAAVVDQTGELILVAEDIGRHNAVDKVIGEALSDHGLDLEGNVLVVSSRISFDIVQKALRADLSTVVGVGAASSLAHELAQHHGLHLFSFTRSDRTNSHTIPKVL